MSEGSKFKVTFNNRFFLPLATTSIVVILAILSLVLVKQQAPVSDVPVAGDNVPVQNSEQIALPEPSIKGGISLDSALKSRRTQRAFQDDSLDLKTVSQMLWAGQGVTADWGGRTAPSAKSTYPLKLYLVANNVDSLEPGQYEYIPGDIKPVHQLVPIKKAQTGKAIYTALNQNSFKDIPALIAITGDMNKMATAYGGVSHDTDVYLEAGHAAQNMYLEAENLKIGMVANSSFNDSIIRNIITIPEVETLIYLIPLGKPKD